MKTVLTVAILMLSTMPLSAHMSVNLAGGAVVCSETDCFVLSKSKTSVGYVRDVLPDKAMIVWNGSYLLTSKKHLTNDAGPDCNWSVGGESVVWMCDGKIAPEPGTASR